MARVVAGLSIALTLAIIASHPRLRAIRKRFGVGFVLSGGIPFLLLGALFGHRSVGILTPDALRDLHPALEFALGWIGFSVGMQFEMRTIERLPAGLDALVAAESLIPAAFAAVAGGLVLAGLGVPWEGGLVRETLVLAACASPSARVEVERLARCSSRAAAETLRDATSLDDVAALVALGLISVFFRPEAAETRWILPPSAWFLAMLGLGGVLGAIAYMLVRRATNESEEVALLLGIVALTSGVSGYLALSVPVVCAVAGALMANLPMHDLDGLRRTMREVERPLYYVFLLIVGAEWDPAAWQGWVLALAFFAARVGGKGVGAWLGIRGSGLELPPTRITWLHLTPQSAISIAAIVAASSAFQGNVPRVARWCISAVIIGSFLAELVTKLEQRRPGGDADLTPMPGEVRS